MSNTSYKPISLLPKVYPKNEHALDIAGGVRIDSISLDLQKIKTLANPKSCPIEFLPLLAYAFGADFYWEFKALTEEQQREMIANSLQLHRKKGTIWAIEKVFDILGFSTEITEWWETKEDPFGIAPTEPYTFTIVLDIANFYQNSKRIFNEYEQRRVLKYLDIYKNVRSHYDLYLRFSSQNNISMPTFSNMSEICTEMCVSRDFVQETTNRVGAVGLSNMRDTAIISFETNPKEEVKNEMLVPTFMSLQEIICL